jgi:hypothetical protein
MIAPSLLDNEWSSATQVLEDNWWLSTSNNTKIKFRERYSSSPNSATEEDHEERKKGTRTMTSTQPAAAAAELSPTHKPASCRPRLIDDTIRDVNNKEDKFLPAKIYPVSILRPAPATTFGGGEEQRVGTDGQKAEGQESLRIRRSPRRGAVTFAGGHETGSFAGDETNTPGDGLLIDHQEGGGNHLIPPHTISNSPIRDNNNVFFPTDVVNEHRHQHAKRLQAQDILTINDDMKKCGRIHHHEDGDDHHDIRASECKEENKNKHKTSYNNEGGESSESFGNIYDDDLPSNSVAALYEVHHQRARPALVATAAASESVSSPTTTSRDTVLRQPREQPVPAAGTKKNAQSESNIITSDL